MSLLQVSGLKVQVGSRLLVQQLEWTVQPGECWVVLGRNGSGKSCLLQHLAGLTQAPSAQIELAGQALPQLSARQRARHLALLLQHSQLGFRQTTEQLVLGGGFARHGGWESSEDLAQARACLAQVGLAGLEQRLAESLSGGELRRAEIARLLFQQANLSMLDEPLNHLDLAHQFMLLKLLREHCVDDQRSLLLVLHDVNLARHVATHLLLLYGDGRWQAGTVAQLGSAQCLGELLGHPLAEHPLSDRGWLIPEAALKDSVDPARIS